MNSAHLHLLLNHAPTVGSVAAVGLLLLAIVRRSEALKHAGLEALVLVALVTLPVFTTGVGAFVALRNQPEISDTAMRLHQDAAIGGFALTEFAGFIAWIALWQFRQQGRASRRLVGAALLLSVVALVLMGRAATLGGEIRHPEIRASVEEPAADAQQFVAAAISDYMANSSTWAWPAAETLHFLGLSLSLGVLLAVNLRILGVIRRIAFADVHRLLPWGMLGLGVNLITGMLFIVAQPGQYVASAPFHWKIILLVIAGANFLYLTVSKWPWAADGGGASVVDKAMAVASIFAWLGALYAGRMLPFLGNAF